MFSRFTIIILAVTVVLLGGLVIQTAFDDKTVNTGTLKSRALNVDIAKGKLVQKELEVRKGEVVALKITTDQPWLIHLHTIEVAKEIKPGNTSFLTFQTNSTGIFEIALHPLHGGMAKNESKDHSHGGGHSHTGEDHSSSEIQKESVAGYISVLPE